MIAFTALLPVVTGLIAGPAMPLARSAAAAPAVEMVRAAAEPLQPQARDARDSGSLQVTRVAAPLQNF